MVKLDITTDLHNGIVALHHCIVYLHYRTVALHHRTFELHHPIVALCVFLFVLRENALALTEHCTTMYMAQRS